VVDVAALASSTVRRRRLATELRRLRGTRTGGAVARALGWSPAKISRYELGQSNFPLDEVEKLLDFYKVTEPSRSQLLALAAEANQRGWWEEYADVLAPEYMEFIGLEAEADTMAHWQVGVVPGLLQTEAYARKLNAGYHSVIPTPPGILERLVRVRMIRQELLTRDPPLHLSVVIDESILLRKIGDRGLMHAQLHRLAEVADLPNVDLRIMPLSSRETSLVADSFAIFSFGSQTTSEVDKLADVVSTENVTSELYVEGETGTYLYRLVFQGLLNASLSPVKSQNLIRQTADELWA
jgi:transcriptional regulator with XRE-family HTH domain